MHSRLRHSRGVTLIEMVLTIVIMGILAAVLSTILTGPIRGYVDTGRRAALVDVGETALNRITRELRQALPNSVRITTSGNRTALEFLRAVTGGRYRAQQDCTTPPCTGDILDFTAADGSFDVMGGLLQAPAAGQWVVVYNTSSGGASGNAYVGDNRASVGAGSTPTLVNLNPAFLFPFASPEQRFFVVDSPVSFVCDTGNGTIRRHDGYAINAVQSTTPSGGTASLLVNSVTACDIVYDPGTHSRAGLVTIRLTLTEPTLNESVTLFQQAHVLNVP